LPLLRRWSRYEAVFFKLTFFKSFNLSWWQTKETRTETIAFSSIPNLKTKQQKNHTKKETPLDPFSPQSHDLYPHLL
jgi:hypothetical protein